MSKNEIGTTTAKVEPAAAVHPTLDAHRLVPDDVVPASRKLGRDDAEGLAKAASKLIVAKGKKVTHLAWAPKRPMMRSTMWSNRSACTDAACW